jgi:phosphatidylserine decarboxylase
MKPLIKYFYRQVDPEKLFVIVRANKFIVCLEFVFKVRLHIVICRVQFVFWHM